MKPNCTCYCHNDRELSGRGCLEVDCCKPVQEITGDFLVGVKAERKRCVEIIKDFKFSDWSDEQALYNQMEEIIEKINEN